MTNMILLAYSVWSMNIEEESKKKKHHIVFDNLYEKESSSCTLNEEYHASKAYTFRRSNK